MPLYFGISTFYLRRIVLLELIHKILYTGIGMAALTEQKAREIVDDLVEKGEVSSHESKKLVQKLPDKAKHHRDEFKKSVSKEVSKMIEKSHLVSRKEFDDLQARVAQLENSGNGSASA